MRVRLLAFLISVSPWARKRLWRWWYERLAREAPTPTWVFMNYGFVWPDGEQAPVLTPDDEPERLYVQLYHRVASPGALHGRDVLEVGAGRGGGASYVARCLAPARMTAVDFSTEAVAFCTQRHAIPNLTFQVGDALHLPFADASFDAVLNVESSHCYASEEAFFREAARVLRPGGFFLIADLRDPPGMASMEAHLRGVATLEFVAREDITPHVAAALEADDARKRAAILALCPPRERALFEQFAGLTGSIVQRKIASREILYHRFVFRRGA
ncbi:MAG: class I SAM-dependent methyltransferase [Verrucomicrobia bacterium]|nr:class I SAM-dependent methyltransferase [Verrucomicrobiota bacterium]